MENKNDPSWLVRLLIPIIEKLVPPAQRQRVMTMLEKRRDSAPEFLLEAAYLVADSYRVQSDALNRTLFAAELFGLIYCFAHVLLPIRMFVMSAAVLGALTGYDFYTSSAKNAQPASPDEAKSKPGVIDPDPDDTRSLLSYFLQELGATVIVVVVLLVVDFLNQHSSPALSGPNRMFFRGFIVFIPLSGTLRLILRRRPEAKPPLRKSKLTLDQLYKMMPAVNDAFAVLSIFTIVFSTENSFGAPPSYRLSLYVLAFAMFLMWIRLPINALARDSHTRTLDFEKQEAAQRAAALRPEMQKDDPLYKYWVWLNVLLPVVLAAPLAVNLLSWIAGRGFGAGRMSFALNLSLFVVTMVSWSVIRRINRELVTLLQPPAKAPATKVPDSEKTFGSPVIF